MEKVMAQMAEVEDRQTISKSVIKSEIKSMKKVSKLYRALQIVKYNTKKATYKFIKRTVDICAGLVGTMLLLPIMAVVKIAYLKQGDRAPILFKQKRIGKDGKEIEIYKIRSMVCNAEEVLKKLMKEDPKIRAEYKKNKKLEHDPRVTKIGKFLRKTSLDEFRTVYRCEFKFSKDLINKFRLIHKEIYNISTKTSIYEDDREGKSMGDILYNTTDFFRELCKGKNKSDYIFWIEKCKNSYILVRSPKNIEKNLKKILFDDKKSIKVLTSATLNTVADGEKYYDYYMNSIGLTRNEEIWICKPIRSTFDLKNNTLMYYANDLAHPQNEHEKYINDITNRIIELINITKGKTLILFTSKADMKIVYDNIKNKNLKYNLIIQNDGASQKKIIEKFKDDIDSVLFSTGTFWEGIDIQGKSLSSVIIVRLPFPVLNPIINYKTEMLNNKLDVLVPEMLIKLKQGIGRLIRGKYDKGIVSILDQRISDLSKSSYKQLVFECVEANIVTNKLSVVEKFVREKNIV